MAINFITRQNISRIFRIWSFQYGNVSTSLTPALDTIVEDKGSRLEVKVSRWPHSLNFSYVWLRDHCRCSNCYNINTSQRIFDPSSIPLNLRPVSVNSGGNAVEILWPDGHSSAYDYKFLWQNTYEGVATSYKSVRVTWNKNSFNKITDLSVPLQEYQKSEGQQLLVKSILKYGIGFVSEVPHNVKATEELVEKFCPIKNTYYGKMWAFEDNLEYADTAYTNQYLGAHTDGTYFSESPRIQVFHCLKAAPTGGETLLVDGFHISELLKKSSPSGYEFLSTVYVPSEAIEKNQHQKCTDVVFKHCPVTKEIFQFRCNIYDRAPLSSIPFRKIDDYYRHLQTLTALIRLPKNEVWHKLIPGHVMFIDNWRVMHGRAEYSGPRIMSGCYIDNSDFTSKARILGVSA